MRLIPKMFSVVVLVGCFDIAGAMAGELACDGPYKDRRPTPEELEPSFAAIRRGASLT